MKRDPLKIRHPQFENNILDESVHGRKWWIQQYLSCRPIPVVEYKSVVAQQSEVQIINMFVNI